LQVQAADAEGRSSVMRVLVISPDRNLAQFLERELREPGFEVVASRPGPAVVAAAREGRPEIAVIHCSEARRETAVLEHAIVRAFRPDVRTIVVSGAPSAADAEIIQLGVFYYMSASPPVRLPDVVRAAARSIRDEADRQLKQGEMR
jgi:ActR/RegA family two-component response regulator